MICYQIPTSQQKEIDNLFMSMEPCARVAYLALLLVCLQTEQMLKAAEGLLGKYEWGQYDLLVLPPSFPYGGMENPCLTFVTPTLLVRCQIVLIIFII